MESKRAFSGIETGCSFSPEVEERVEDLSHRVLDKGYDLASENMGLVYKKLTYQAVDEYSFYKVVCRAYTNTTKAIERNKSLMIQRSIPLQHGKVQEALTERYLEGKSEEEALAFMMDSERIWNLLELEANAVKERIMQDALIKLLENGYEKWRLATEFAPTLQWGEGPFSIRQLQCLFLELVKIRFISEQTKEEHFVALFTSSRPLYKVMWTQRGLPSLIYMAEKLLRVGLLAAPDEIVTAARTKRVLEQDRVVLPWLYKLIGSSFSFRDMKGTLKDITSDMLVDARHKAWTYRLQSQALPGWASKLDGIIDNVRRVS